MFIKTIFKDSRKVKIIRNYAFKMQFIAVFLDIANLLISGEKYANVSRTQGLCHVFHIYFGSSLGKV